MQGNAGICQSEDALKALLAGPGPLYLGWRDQRLAGHDDQYFAASRTCRRSAVALELWIPGKQTTGQTIQADADGRGDFSRHGLGVPGKGWA